MRWLTTSTAGFCSTCCGGWPRRPDWSLGSGPVKDRPAPLSLSADDLTVDGHDRPASTPGGFDPSKSQHGKAAGKSCRFFSYWPDDERTIDGEPVDRPLNRPINSVYAARLGADCAADQRIDGTPRAGVRQLSVFLDKFSGFARMQALAAVGDKCRAGPGLVVCSDIPDEAPM